MPPHRGDVRPAVATCRATEVCITIDTEFSIGGTFDNPHHSRPVGDSAVLCPVEGREHGLGFLLDCFASYDIPATFFVETLNHHYFGDGPMGRHVERILAAGQDVQLHVHPCWTYFRRGDWAGRLGDEPPDDRCDGRSLEAMCALIDDGIATLCRWGVPGVVALRTGSLHADRTVYRAMAACGLPVASNLGIAYTRPADAGLHLASGRHMIEGVLELPVLSYTDLRLGRWTHDRLLTVTAASWRETEALLWAARRAGLSPVVILTHPFEFAKVGDAQFRRIGQNRINQRRLECLCAFVAAHPDSFRAVSFSGAAPAWLADGPQAATGLTVPTAAALGRMVSNTLNDLIRWL